MVDQGGALRQLGPLEASVMDRLWSATEPMTVREVLEQLNGEAERELAYTTVMSVVDNLLRKGRVQRHPGPGRAYRYTATLTREEYTAHVMGAALAATPVRQGALLHFLDQLPAEDVAALRAALGQGTEEGLGRR